MTVPEAAMHETDGFEPGEDHVRRAGEIPIVQTVPEARARCNARRRINSGFVSLPPIPAIMRDRTCSIHYVRHELTCFARGKKRYHPCISQNGVEAFKKDAN